MVYLGGHEETKVRSL